MQRRLPWFPTLCCIWFFSATTLAAGMSEAELESLFLEAKDCFREANSMMAKDPKAAKELYQKAALRFEHITTEGGIKNGKLYYNIGNTYFRMGEIGRAILYYRRAEIFIPNDINLQQNLAFVRTRCVDKIEVAGKKAVLKTVFFWHYDLSAQIRSGIFVFFWAILWVLAGVRLWSKATPIFWGIVASVIVALMFAGSVGVDLLSDTEKAGVILDREVIARKGDSTTYDPSFKEPLHAGTEFVLRENRRDWYYIELLDGRRSWLPAKSVGLVE